MGRAILHNIMKCGFRGSVYAVNPHATQTRTMEGARCVVSVADLPEAVDLAVLAVPRAAVPHVAAERGRHGVRALTVITSGLGGEGADLLAICRRYGMRLVGPNSFGVSVPEIGLNATSAASHPAPGVAGLVVQSGGAGAALLEQLSRLGIGVSSFAAVGDKYDVSSDDLLMWWAQDDVTRLAILYVESFGRPGKFARAARRVGHQMPVLTVVGGRSTTGPRAAASPAAAVLTSPVTPLMVLKAEAEGLVHKSEGGAVKLDLHTPQEVTDAYRALAAGLGSSLQRVLVQPRIADGVEVLIGVVQEPVFGPLVVFGLGGVATEVLGDHATLLTPLTATDADELIHSVHAAPLLFGHRGTPLADVGALADTLLRISRLADDLPEVAELDLNPVIARPDGVHAVDVRVRVSPAESRDPFLRQLR
jgi:acyl-CoA synthetase (NDP forming)